MSESVSVHGIPRLTVQQGDVPVLLIENVISLEQLVFQGVSQKAAGAYKSLLLPDTDRAYLLEANHVQWALRFLAENPKWIAHIFNRRSFVKSRARSLPNPALAPSHLSGDPEEIIELLRSIMSRSQIERISDLEALTWPRHRLPFLRAQRFINRINLLGGSIQQTGADQWEPSSDPEARLLLEVNHQRVLVDLAESFAAAIDQEETGQGSASVCRQFDGKTALLEWLQQLVGGSGYVRVLPWNHKMQMPNRLYLGDLRAWIKHLAAWDPNQPQLQMALDSTGTGVWEWLGGRAAFCEPVRHRGQGNQEENQPLREKMLLHQAGPLVHPGYPEQPHRRGNDAPGVEFYRPLNPFGGS